MHVICGKCNKRFRHQRALILHQKACLNEKKLSCDICSKYETVKTSNYKRHRLLCLKRLTEGVFDNDNNAPRSSSSSSLPISSIRNFPCDICQRPHGNMSELINHRNVHSSVPTGMPTAISNDFASIQISKHAFGGRLCDYDLISHEPCSDVQQFFQMSADLLRSLFKDLSPTYSIDGRLVLSARFFKINDEGRRIHEFFQYFPSLPMGTVLSDGEDWYLAHTARILELMEKLNLQSSNIEFDSIERVFVKLNLRENVIGHGTFPLPPELAKKRQVIVNVDTTSECFKYAILSKLHYDDVSNSQRSNKQAYREWEGELDFGNIDADEVSISDIATIEKLNNIKINVHVWEGASSLSIRYNNRQSIAPKTVNLLLVSYQGLQHYCAIVSLKRLYWSIEDKSHHVSEFCERCCREFSSWRNKSEGVKESLAEHYRFCREGRLQIETLPSDSTFSYTSFSAEESPAVVCYSDIESYITPQTKEHCPYAIGMYPVYHKHFNEKRKAATMRTWTGEKCLQNYLAYLDRFVRELDTQIDSLTNQAMIIDPTEQYAFDIATHCPRCKTEFTTGGTHGKVRDHCHITGKYRGPLCHKCNSRLRFKRRILPVVFHNFKGYDSHLICKQAIGEMPGWHLSVIPVTHEKYMSLRASVEVGKSMNGRARMFQITVVAAYCGHPGPGATVHINRRSTITEVTQNSM